MGPPDFPNFGKGPISPVDKRIEADVPRYKKEETLCRFGEEWRKKCVARETKSLQETVIAAGLKCQNWTNMTFNVL